METNSPTSTNGNGQGVEQESAKQIQSSWPSETLMDSIELVNKIVEQKGSAKPVSRKEISVITGKAEATLVMKLSTCVQYGLLENKFGQGYIPAEFYDKYCNPVFESDKQKAMLRMFSNPELYKKLINEYNGKNLPNEVGLSNHLKSDFGLNPNSSLKAAKIFFENSRQLEVIDTGNRLRFLIPENTGSNTPIQPKTDPGGQPPPPPPPPAGEEDSTLFTLPIPLDAKRKAYIKYPLNDLKKKDIKVIVKALSFIASSIMDDEQDFEITITETKKEGG